MLSEDQKFIGKVYSTWKKKENTFGQSAVTIPEYLFSMLETDIHLQDIKMSLNSAYFNEEVKKETDECTKEPDS